MDSKVVNALKVLGFDDLTTIPKVKDIVHRYRKLAIIKHPDKNGGTPESISDFQVLLNAYDVAGKAAEKVPVDPEDNADHVARKLFQQFQVRALWWISLSKV